MLWIWTQLWKRFTDLQLFVVITDNATKCATTFIYIITIFILLTFFLRRVKACHANFYNASNYFQNVVVHLKIFFGYFIKICLKC